MTCSWPLQWNCRPFPPSYPPEREDIISIASEMPQRAVNQQKKPTPDYCFSELKPEAYLTLQCCHYAEVSSVRSWALGPPKATQVAVPHWPTGRQHRGRGLLPLGATVCKLRRQTSVHSSLEWQTSKSPAVQAGKVLAAQLSGPNWTWNMALLGGTLHI